METARRRSYCVDLLGDGIQSLHELLAQFSIPAGQFYTVRYALSVELQIMDLCGHFDALDYCHSLFACTLRGATWLLCPQSARARVGSCGVVPPLRFFTVLSFASLVCRLVGRHACQLQYVVESSYPGMVLGVVH